MRQNPQFFAAAYRAHIIGTGMGRCPGNHLFIGAGAKNNCSLGMPLQKRLEALHGLMLPHPVQVQGRCKRLRRKHQRGFIVPLRLFQQPQETGILLRLRKGLEFLIRVIIGLADNDLQGRPLLLKLEAGAPHHGAEKDENGHHKGRHAGLAGPAGHTAVAQGHHKAEER